MEINELKIICNALSRYRRLCLEKQWDIEYEDYKEVQKIEHKYENKLRNRRKYCYLVIRWNWIWYSWQSNCDRWERWSWCKKVSAKSLYYDNVYTQHFSDWTYNIWKVTFEDEKPKVNNSLWWYEWWLREQWLPV